MKIETLEGLIRGLMKNEMLADNFSIVWHAGEPLILGPRYYLDAMQKVKDLTNGRHSVQFHFQTNGTLLNESWEELVLSKDVEFGVSIDGPQWLHDQHRKDWLNRGSFQAASKAIRFLQSFGREVRIISVITKEHLPFANAYFQFLLEHKIKYIGLNFEEIEGANADSTHSGETLEEYRSFLSQLYELNCKSNSKLNFREFDQLNELFKRGTPVDSSCANPFQILTVSTDGGISSFSPELLGQKHAEYSDFRFWDIESLNRGQLLESKSFLKALQEIELGVSLCQKTCAYFSICGGGDPSNKLYENGTFASTRTTNCQAKIMIPAQVFIEKSHFEGELHDAL
jgi:uncharacterized protein